MYTTYSMHGPPLPGAISRFLFSFYYTISWNYGLFLLLLDTGMLWSDKMDRTIHIWGLLFALSTRCTIAICDFILHYFNISESCHFYVLSDIYICRLIEGLGPGKLEAKPSHHFANVTTDRMFKHVGIMQAKSQT